MVGSALRAFVVRSAAAALVVCSLPLSETAAAASVPWAPDCEFLPLGELPGPMEVSGVAPANDVVCYAVKPIAGSHISIEVAEDRNVIFSVRSAPGHPDLIVLYRGFRCAGIDDAPLRHGGFCGLTMDGMKCLVEVYTYREGDYVKASERIA